MEDVEFVAYLAAAGYALNWISTVLPNGSANPVINFLLKVVNFLSANMGTSKNKE